MLQNIFKNMQPVVKNLLIINLLFFLATFVFEGQGIDLNMVLGLKYFDSPSFQPYQLVTHFFMHGGGFGHVFFNMFALIVFGSMLEREWGAKKFLTFYFISAIGAAILYMVIQAIESYYYVGTIFPYTEEFVQLKNNSLYYVKGGIENFDGLANAVFANSTGASGAIYGLLMGVAMLFPNTTVYLYFAIPVKMKWVALGLGVMALFGGMQNESSPDGTSIAHFAHLTGMLVAFILIKVWQRDKTEFY